ncbi:phosphodiester glycosidase family protein [Streptacidiphilus melanogenes]|uniref:phosphodiester glycosidase family protein n=1 Tax=Streptacidiphilus melanogenes TaxID=411235 RepID=UPI0005AAE079|nr:phosphodiester glycosidase family protein [Streptacidiphilus melanogenes]
MGVPASPESVSENPAEEPAQSEGGPMPPKKQRFRRTRRILRLRSVRAVLALLAVVFAWLCWSVGSALAAPGDDSVVARVAEWARDHHLGPVVTFLEDQQYKAHPPKIGGRPTMALAPNGEPVQNNTSNRPALKPITPPRLVSPAGAPLPGEGTWQTLENVDGTPALLGAFLRPDDEHTSYVAAVVSMDERLVRFTLHPGQSDPGPGNWGVPFSIPAGQRTGLLATFNGGFKVINDEAQGGFYLNGTTRGTLHDGAASLVFTKDGRATVADWGRDASLTPDVSGVRQNLKLIVDHGKVPDSVDSNVESGWGLTIAGKYFVWRSGVGVTADGRLLFAYGPALSVRTLADLLASAGAVRGMQLDINPAWMSFMYYKPQPNPANPTPVKLLPDQERPATRYYEDTSRDFTAVYAR